MHGAHVHWEFNVEIVIPSVSREVLIFQEFFLCISTLDSHHKPVAQRSILLTCEKRDVREMIRLFDIT